MKKARFKVGDKVRILDGSKIKDYTGCWNRFSMSKYVGKVVTIRQVLNTYASGPAYKVEGNSFSWDERGLAPVDETIVIYRKGQDVIALNKATGKTAKARCNPSDKFDFAVGVQIAFDRLIRFAEPDESVIKVGDKVKVIDTGEGYTTNISWIENNIEDVRVAARFAYDDDMGYGKGIRELNDIFTVLAVAENKAYISEDNDEYGKCYLIGLSGLKKC